LGVETLETLVTGGFALVKQILLNLNLLLLSICIIFVEKLIIFYIMIDNIVKKRLEKDADGLLTYEYIANNIDSCYEDMDFLVENMIKVDLSGQFVASASRYLYAIDAHGYEKQISRLIAAVIEKDREHKYLPDLIQGIWGKDYAQRVEELNKDDNFRRIYKRLYPKGI